MGGIDSNAKLVLHCEGTDATTAFTDSSASSHTLTANGDAQIDTAQKKFGSASGLFDGTGDYLTASDNSDWNFGSSDFTIDCYVRHAVWADDNYQVAGQYSFGNSNTGWAFWLNGGASANMSFHYTTDGSTDNSLSVNATMTTNTWYHIAVVRNGADLMFFLDGTQQGATQNISTDTIYNSTRNLEFGGESVNNTRYYNGHIDELRISDSARWTSNFTPQAYAYGYEDTATVTISMTPSVNDARIIRLDYEYYFGTDTGTTHIYSDTYKGDAGVIISCQYVTKNTDFSDQDPSANDKWKTVYAVKLFYEDVFSSTDIVVAISTDGGTTWNKTQTQTLGTGDETRKDATYYFICTGQFFMFRISSGSASSFFKFLGLEIEYEYAGEHFVIA